MSDTLFDGFGEPRRRRPVKKTPTEIRLNKPWVLLGHPTHEPMAHLLNEKAIVPNKDNAWLTRCGRYGYKIDVPGHPMAKVCRTCLASTR